MSDLIKEALEAFELCQDAESENRINFKNDVDFARLGNQWPEQQRKERETSGRPCLTINKLQPVIRQVVNDSRQNRPSIKVNPVDSKADPETAKVLAGIIRNIENRSNADVAYDTAIDNAVSGGWGYWKINTDYSLNALTEEGIRSAGPAAFEQDIFIRRVANPLSVFGDPHSSAADSSDWNIAFEVEALSKDNFQRKYKGAEESDFSSDAWRGIGAPWLDEETVQVASYWKREEAEKKAVLIQLMDPETGEGDTIVMLADDPELKLAVEAGARVLGERPIKSFKVTQHIMSGAEELEAKPWAGAYIPIIPVYGDEVMVDGKRHLRSLIRDAKDAQLMLNYWETTATEVAALAPRVPYLIEEDGIPKGEQRKWDTANSHSHPYLKYKKGTNLPTRQAPPSVPQGFVERALSASDNIKAITGIYDASLGARSNETSGRAIMARQREGDVSTFHFIDNLTRAIRHSGVILLDLIPKVYSTERVVRILGEDGKPDSVQINAEGAMRMHDVRTGLYDVTVTAGPSFTTRREEAATQMIELIRAYPDAAPIIGDLLAKNLDWPGADEIAERLEKMLPPNLRDEEGGVPPEIQQQVQEMMQALQEMGQKLQEAESKRDIELMKVKVDGYKAETDRMQALAPAMGPNELMPLIVQCLQQLASDGLPNAEDAPIGSGSFEQPGMGQAA